MIYVIQEDVISQMDSIYNLLTQKVILIDAYLYKSIAK